MATEEMEISELEFTEELAGDNLIPVESTTDTKATSLQILKNWLGSFFVGLAGNQEIGGVKTFSNSPILKTATGNMVAVFNANKQLVSDSNVSTTEISYLNGVTSNIQTQLNNKVSSPITALCTTNATTTSSASSTKPAVVVQNYVSGALWYRVYSDGWIEQGGISEKDTTITLKKPYKNTNYGVQVTFNNTDAGNGTYGTNASNKTTTSFVCKTSTSGNKMAWYAYGY